MSPDTSQSFANHARMVPGYHYVTGPLTFTYLVWSLVRAFTQRDADALYALTGAGALFGVYAYTRLFPLKVQDRLIRLEERLRLERRLPAELAARVPELTERQLIALRFASDEELESLVREVLEGRVTAAKQIKQRVRNWRADHFRV
jgi:hypothetical protein